MRSLQQRLTAATDLWQITKVLLEEWRSRLPADGGARSMRDDRYDRWSDLIVDVIGFFEARMESGSSLDEVVRQTLSWTNNGADIDAVDAVAWGLDNVASASFPSAWRDEVGSGPSARHQLQPGELYPVADAVKEIFTRVSLSSRPSALIRVPVNELPHVRVHADLGYEVVVDFSRDADLEKIGTALSLVATAHPNDTESEFDFAWSSRRVVFPVTIRDATEQTDRLERLVDIAINAGARIVVLPELAATPQAEARLRELLDSAESQHLVVAGSRHIGNGASAENVALALSPDCGEPLRHSKVVPFSDELGLAPPWKEGISLRERPMLTIYQGDRFRFSILICKDMLDQTVVAAITRAGANVVLVPAMSEKTASYPLRVGQLVADAQAIVVVANNPLEWNGHAVDPMAVFGQPVQGQEIVPVTPRDKPAGLAAPCLSFFRLGDDRVRVMPV